MIKLKHILSLLVVAFLYIGCGSSNNSNQETVTGVLADGAIGNAEYRCGAITGVTNANGEFTCLKNSPVSFYFGSLLLGGVDTIPDDKVVLIQDTLDVDRDNTNDPNVMRMAQFLQSLDNDSDHTNGIFLTEQTIQAINERFENQDVDFKNLNDDDIVNIILSDNKQIIDAGTAQKNLEETTNRVKQKGIEGVKYTSESNNNSGGSNSSSGSNNSGGSSNNSGGGSNSGGSSSSSSPATLGGVYYNSNRLDNGDNNISIGKQRTLTLNFDKAMKAAGSSVSSTLGATLGSLSASGNSITFNYLPGARLFNPSDKTKTETLNITAVTNDNISKSYTASFTLTDVNSSQTEITLTSTGSLNSFYSDDVLIKGDYFFAGSISDNHVAIYRLSNENISVADANLTPQNTSGWFGHTIAFNGDYIAVAAPIESASGATYLYKLDKSNLSNTNSSRVRLTGSGLTGATQFGTDIAMTDDYLIVGADAANSSANKAFLFTIDKTTLSDTNATQVILSASDATSNNYFGSVAMNDNYIVVGAYGQNTDGAVYVYPMQANLNDINATQYKITPRSTTGSDRFGYKVAINSKYILIGQMAYDASGVSDSGIAWLYEIPANIADINSTNVIQLTPSNPISSGEFGRSVSLSEEYAIVGMVQNSAGQGAYLFDLNASDINASQIKLTSQNVGSHREYALSVSTDGNNSIVRHRDDGKFDIYNHVNP